MEASEHPFTIIEELKIINIPFFQRSYVWKVDNWQLLLDDLLDFDSRTFLGSLILHRTSHGSGKVDQVNVTDGQQRLTTISILYKCLYEILIEGLSEEEKKPYDEKKNRFLFYRKNSRSTENFVKLKHSKVDRDIYEKIITSNKDGIMKLEESSRLVKCFKFFYNQLNEIKEARGKETLEKLYDRIMDENEKVWVVIDLDENDNEQAIFDAINSTGIRLSYADTIKNFIFQKALELCNDEDKVLSCYKKNWEQVFEDSTDCIEYWQTETTSGRVKRNNIEVCLYSFAVVDGFFAPVVNKLEELPQLYKKRIENFLPDTILTFIEQIANFAKMYKEKIVAFEASSLFEFNNFEQRLFHILNVCVVTTFNPYILKLYQQYSNKPEILKLRFKELETLIIRRAIARENTRTYYTWCAEFLKDESAVAKRIAETSDDRVAVGLCDINNKLASLILFWIELNRRYTDEKTDITTLKYSYSLEHILPRTWQNSWANVAVVDNNGKEIKDKEEANRVRNEKCYEIGNMTLLKSKLNTSISNSEFAIKMNGNPNSRGNGKKGIKDYAELKITKEIVDNYENGRTIWNEEVINNRTINLTNEILSLWPNRVE